MDRISQTQLQVGENSDWIIWRLGVNQALFIGHNFWPVVSVCALKWLCEAERLRLRCFSAVFWSQETGWAVNVIYTEIPHYFSAAKLLSLSRAKHITLPGAVRSYIRADRSPHANSVSDTKRSLALTADCFSLFHHKGYKLEFYY